MKEKAKDKEILSPDDISGTAPHPRVLQVIPYIKTLGWNSVILIIS